MLGFLVRIDLQRERALMKTSTVLFLSLFSAAFAVVRAAQDTLHGLEGSIQRSYSISGTTLRFEWHDPAPNWGAGDGSGEVDITEFDLSTLEVREFASDAGTFV